MYINKRKHILSNYILSIAVIRTIIAGSAVGFRFLLNRNQTLTPDMLNSASWMIQNLLAFLKIGLTVIIFFFYRRKMNHFLNIVPNSEQKEIALLQREYLSENISTLSMSSINRLLQLWTAIFIGAEVIYAFSSMMYRRFILVLVNSIFSLSLISANDFTTVYNMTHGFKYLEILIALILGVAVTGIFLNDTLLKISAVAVTVIFLTAFAVFQMQTVTFMGREIGIVWTSIIYHLIETAGLLLLSIYLAKRYKGL